jgi:hypothetical protein
MYPSFRQLPSLPLNREMTGENFFVDVYQGELIEANAL